MIIGLILFLLIIGISFILAFRSMKDYQEIPKDSKVEYGLFLIRQTASFGASILDSMGRLMLEAGLIISLERLFKGHQAALTIFGPKKILDKFKESLNLLELEDYTLELDNKDISVWEVGMKSASKLDLPELGNEDQFFWQVVLGAKKVKDNLSFQTQIRAVVYCQDPQRRKVLVPMFENLQTGGLVKIPRPFSTEQMMAFYKLRSLSKDSNGPILDSEGVMSLLKV